MRFPRFFASAGIAAIVGAAVIGSAAALTNTVPALGGDTAAVASCDTDVTTSWDTAYDATVGGYKVTNVTVASIDGAACENAMLKVTLANSDNTALGSEQSATILAEDFEKVLDFSADNVPAEDITNVSVVLVGGGA